MNERVNEVWPLPALPPAVAASHLLKARRNLPAVRMNTRSGESEIGATLAEHFVMLLETMIAEGALTPTQQAVLRSYYLSEHLCTYSGYRVGGTRRQKGRLNAVYFDCPGCIESSAKRRKVAINPLTGRVVAHPQPWAIEDTADELGISARKALEARRAIDRIVAWHMGWLGPVASSTA